MREVVLLGEVLRLRVGQCRGGRRGRGERVGRGSVENLRVRARKPPPANTKKRQGREREGGGKVSLLCSVIVGEKKEV